MKDIIKHYIQIPFLLCIITLAASGGLISFLKAHYGVTIIKKPLPLKKSFDLLNESALQQYRVINKQNITNKDILESLGTEDYLQWTFEDTSEPDISPVKNCSLFITYYTGNPDQVPHVPEACYTGGGSQIKNKFSITLNLNDANAPKVSDNNKIPATCLIFTKASSEIWQAANEFPVIYFFKVNGKYEGNRTSTRLALGNLRSKYSYFSKIEIKFLNLRGLYPDKNNAIAATKKFLKVVLPLLEKDHWPDWEKANTN